MSEAGDKIIAGLNEALTEAERALCGALDAFVETHIEIVGNIEDAATRIIELSRQLHAAEADAARLAEALGDCADDLESEVNAANPPAWGDVYPIMARRRQRDLEPVKKAREALAAHTARLING